MLPGRLKLSRAPTFSMRVQPAVRELLAAAVGLDDELRRVLEHGTGMFLDGEPQFSGLLRDQVPTHNAERTSVAPSGQVAPGSAHHRHICAVPDPDLVGGRGS